MVSVVIPFRNARNDLPTLVDALRRQTLGPSKFEVIWVDDASRDGGGRWLSDQLAPGWRLLVHPEARGSYAARNTALSHAAAESVAFTDADCRPDAGWLEHGLAALRSAPRIAGRIHLELSTHPTIAERVDAGRFLRQRRYVEEGFAATANLFVRRAVFDRVGGFDEDLISGGDHEFGWRCERAGIPIRYVENVVVNHPARTSLGQLLGKARRVGIGIGQVVRRGRMPVGELARSGMDRLSLVGRRASSGQARSEPIEARSLGVTVVHLLVILMTTFGCLAGLAAPQGRAPSGPGGVRQKNSA
jgi:glycosyltransferase involved in cell wall biosynthesis